MSARSRPRAVSLVAMGIAAMNLVYAWGTARQLLEAGQNAALSEVAISALAAQSGIVVILVWVLADPVARRGALLAMIMPMLLGSVLYGIHLYQFDGAGVMRLTGNATFSLLCSAGIYRVYRYARP